MNTPLARRWTWILPFVAWIDAHAQDPTEFADRVAMLGRDEPWLVCDGYARTRDVSSPGEALFAVDGWQFNLPLNETGAYDLLLNTCEFVTDDVDSSGTPPVQWHALHVLLAEPDAVTRLRILGRRANVAGRLYALLGLHGRDAQAFEELRRELLLLREDVATDVGCYSCSRSPSRLLPAIVDGRLPQKLREARARAAAAYRGTPR
jgi:hypothetical protein